MSDFEPMIENIFDIIYTNLSKIFVFRYINNYSWFDDDIENDDFILKRDNIENKFSIIFDILKKNSNANYNYTIFELNDNVFKLYNKQNINKYNVRFFIKIFLNDENDTIITKNMSDQILKSKYDKNDHLIISINNVQDKIINMFKKNFKNIEIFKEIELMTNFFCINSNNDYFKVIKSNDKKLKFLKEYNNSLKNMPKIVENDIIVKISESKKNDIIKFYTLTESGINSEYRLVSNYSSNDDFLSNENEDD